MKDLNKLIDFIKFTHEIRRVKRAMVFEGSIHENDQEHSYQLALVAWFLIDTDNLKLDKYRCVGMAMVHDIVEVYAGDTIAFASSKELKVQPQKEKEAAEKLAKEWPSFISLHELIDEYEKQYTEESKFVYALDKLLPIINNYLFDGKAWKEHGVTFEKMKNIKVGKIEPSLEVNAYYQKVLVILEQKPDLFSDKNWSEL